jgi:hypothetical protein
MGDDEKLKKLRTHAKTTVTFMYSRSLRTKKIQQYCKYEVPMNYSMLLSILKFHLVAFFANADG